MVAALTEKPIAVKPLKVSMAAKKDIKVKRYSLAEAVRLLQSKKLNLKSPFVITKGVAELETLQAKLTAEQFIALQDARIRYYAPVVAKKTRSFDQQQQQPQDQEEYEVQVISLEDWFRECFNLGARPDFRRMPGYGTEHCEQMLDSATLPQEWVDLLALSAIGDLDMTALRDMATEREKFVTTHKDELLKSVPNHLDLKTAILACPPCTWRCDFVEVSRTLSSPWRS